MKKSITIILLISILSIVQSCQIESHISKNLNLSKLIENCHFTLNKSIVEDNLGNFILEDFAEKFKNLNLLAEKKSNSGFNIQSYTNRDDNNFKVIRPKFPIYFIIYSLAFLFYILGGTISLIIILKNEFKNQIDKIAWVITIIFAPIIGIFLFIFLGRKQIKVKNIENN